MRSVLIIILLLATIHPAFALDYEERPKISISNILIFDEVTRNFVPKKNIEKGEKLIQIYVFNDARREWIKFDDVREAIFFSDETILFIAYNVEFVLEGSEKVEVLSEKIYLPALLPAKEPIPLVFRIKVKDLGDIDLRLKASFYRIESVRLGNFYEMRVPKTVTNTTYSGNITTSVTYEYQIKLMEQDIDFVRVEQEIPIKLFAEEVKIEVVDFSQNRVFGSGKGELYIKIKNVGNKDAREAQIVFRLPSEFDEVKQATTPITFPMMQAIPMQTQQQSQKEIVYYIGDLKEGEFAEAKVRFNVKVGEGGNYTMYVKLRYLDEFGKLRESNEVPVVFIVEDKPSVSIVKVESGVYINSKGKVIVKFSLNKDLPKVIAKLNANSPISVLSSECYIGDVKAGEVYDAVFSVRTSRDAEAVKYPAELIIKFESEGEVFELKPVVLGIKVNPKFEFLAKGIAEVHAGEEKIVSFRIVNLANASIRDATARITLVDPFTSTDDTAFIGDLLPQEGKDVKFKIMAERDATPKLYSLDLEIKFKDGEGNWVYSEPIKVLIEVKPVRFPYHLVAPIALIVLIVSLYYIKRKKR